MKIKLISVHVDDQQNALNFDTDVLGFVKKSDLQNGSFRRLTVASPQDPDGAELQLTLGLNPEARAYQQATLLVNPGDRRISSVRLTERHYSPWIKARQKQLEKDARRTWTLSAAKGDRRGLKRLSTSNRRKTVA